MIRLTRYNHEPVVVNAHQVAYVDATPDTIVTLVNGERMHVRESVDEVVERVVGFLRRIQAGPIPLDHGEER